MAHSKSKEMLTDTWFVCIVNSPHVGTAIESKIYWIKLCARKNTWYFQKVELGIRFKTKQLFNQSL